MTTTATAILQLAATGDRVYGPQSFAATPNAASPWNDQLVALVNGPTMIPVPATATRISITGKPVGNTVAMTFKGIAGDTGIPLGLVDWDSLSLPTPPPANVVIAATGAVTVRVTFG